MPILWRGASFSAVTSTTVVVAINYADKTTKVRLSSLRIDDILNEAPNTATFTVVGLAPTVGQDVKIGLGGIGASNRIFGGTITTVTQIYEGVRANVAYQVTCQDYTYLLNRRRPIVNYVAQSATAVVKDLIQQYASTTFSTGNVAASLASVTVAFDGSQDLAACLTTVANLAGCYWYPDANKDIHFFVTEATNTPATIDATNIAPTNTNGARSLAETLDLSQIRTRVFVRYKSTTAGLAAAVGSTTLVVASGDMLPSSGTILSGPQRITYTGSGISTPAGGPTFVVNTPGVVQKGGTLSYKYSYVIGNVESALSAAAGTSVAANTIGNYTGTATVTPSAGGGLTASSSYDYYICYCGAGGVVTAGQNKTGNTGVGQGTNALTAMSAWGSSGVWGSAVGIAVYRTKAGGGVGDPHYLVGMTTMDGVANTLTDSTADTALGIPLNSGNVNTNTSGSTITVTVTNGPAGTTAKRIYREKTTTAGTFYVLGTIGDNATVTFSDNIADSALSQLAPTSPGASILTGIPASGPGSILYAISEGDPVIPEVQRDDLTAQATLAASEGGDGIHEFIISDSSFATSTAANARGDAELALFKNALPDLGYVTRDILTRSGKTVTVNLGTPTNISVSLQIQQATWTGFDAVGNFPLITVKAAMTKFTVIDLLRRVAL